MRQSINWRPHVGGSQPLHVLWGIGFNTNLPGLVLPDVRQLLSGEYPRFQHLFRRFSQHATCNSVRELTATASGTAGALSVPSARSIVLEPGNLLGVAFLHFFWPPSARERRVDKET